MTPQEIDRIECAIRHIQTSTDIDPWAMGIAVEAMQKQIDHIADSDKKVERTAEIAQNVQNGDLISRKWLVECIEEGWVKFDTAKDCNRMMHLVRDIAPSIQPEQNAQDEDLISRKAAIESIRECAEVAHDNYEGGMEQGYLNAIECVEEEPSAQPEIIRCKDCKHWRFDHTCREHSLVSPMMANEFCSRAERREG